MLWSTDGAMKHLESLLRHSINRTIFLKCRTFVMMGRNNTSIRTIHCPQADIKSVIIDRLCEWSDANYLSIFRESTVIFNQRGLYKVYS